MFWGRDEVDIEVVHAEGVGLSFKLAMEAREQRLMQETNRKQMYEERIERAREEERQRLEEEGKVQSELKEDAQYTVAMEVPVLNVHRDGGITVDYQRVLSNDEADEVFPGYSQPPITQEQPTQPAPSIAPQPKSTISKTTPAPNHDQNTPNTSKALTHLTNHQLLLLQVHLRLQTVHTKFLSISYPKALNLQKLLRRGRGLGY